MSLRHAVLLGFLGGAPLGCSAPPPPPFPVRPRFQLKNSKAELTYSAKSKLMTLKVESGDATKVVVKDAKGRQVGESSIDSTLKTTMCLTGEGEIGKNSYTIELSNYFGESFVLPVSIDIADPVTVRWEFTQSEDDKAQDAEVIQTGCEVHIGDDVKSSGVGVTYHGGGAS